MGGALLNILTNILLIPIYGANGAAFAALVAEASVLVIQLVLAYKILPFKPWCIFNKNYIMGCIIVGLSVYVTTYSLNNNLLKLFLGISVGVLTYFVFLFLRKDTLLTEIISPFINSFLERK